MIGSTVLIIFGAITFFGGAGVGLVNLAMSGHIAASLAIAGLLLMLLGLVISWIIEGRRQ